VHAKEKQGREDRGQCIERERLHERRRGERRERECSNVGVKGQIPNNLQYGYASNNNNNNDDDDNDSL